MINVFKKQLANGILTTPIIYIPHYHFAYIDELIEDILTSNMVEGLDVTNVLEYDCAMGGIIDFKTKEHDKKRVGDVDILERIVFPHSSSNSDIDESSDSQESSSTPSHQIFLFKNAGAGHFSTAKNSWLYQRFVERYEQGLYDWRTTIIHVSSAPISDFSIDTVKKLNILNLPLPDRYDIEHELGLGDDQYPPTCWAKREPYETQRYRYGVSFMYGRPNFEKNKRELVCALTGMEIYDIRSILRSIQLTDRTINPWYESQNCKLSDRILQEKRQIIKNTGLLDLINLEPNQKDKVGNINNLLAYVEKQKNIIDNISNYPESLPKPKGILLVGPPGCGKSETVKSIAAILDKPLVRLDIGRLLGGFVGDSERNLRESIHIAESSQPCVLWIDEIEKAFAGAESKRQGGDAGSDTMVHMMGYLLTWMQERKSLVYLVATANDLSSLRPEFLRKGRWDEIFYLSYPDAEGAMDILCKCLKKYGLYIKNRNRDIIAQDGTIVDKGDVESLCFKLAQSNCSGADIDSLVIQSFGEEWDSSFNMRHIEYDTLNNIIDNTTKSKNRAERKEQNDIINDIILDMKLHGLESGIPLDTNAAEQGDNRLGRLPNQDQIVSLLKEKYKLPSSWETSLEYEAKGYKSAAYQKNKNRNLNNNHHEI